MLGRGLLHDISKFLPAEFLAYADNFYGSKKYPERFQLAWHMHQRRNRHHWEWWVKLDGTPLEMDWYSTLEMYCDWVGANKAQGGNGKSDLKRWFDVASQRMVLHENTRTMITYLVRTGGSL